MEGKRDDIKHVWESEYNTMKWAMFLSGLSTGLLLGFIGSFLLWLLIGVSLEQP